MSFFWTPEDKNRVAAMLVDGFSAGQIAARLGDVTRNAVIGVVFRDPELKKIGLQGRVRLPSTSAAPPIEAVRRNQPKRPAQPRFVTRPEPAAPTSLNLPLADLTPGQCKWPTNDVPKGGRFLFCGHARADGSPYCAYHAHRGVRHDT